MRARSGYAELIACGLIWGSIGVIVKRVSLDAPTIVFFRLALGLAVVVAWSAARGRLSSLRLGGRRRLVVANGLTLAAHWILLFEAFKRLDVATTILIVYLGPVLIALGAPLALSERLERRAVGALALSVAGILAIALPDVGELNTTGLALALASAVGFAVLVLLGKRIVRDVAPATLVTWQFAIATLAVAPFLAGSSGREILRAAPALLLLGAVHTGAAGLLYFRALRVVKAQHAGILAYLEPVSAVVYAWVLLSETPPLTTVGGGVLVLIAGAVVVLGSGRPQVAAAGLPEPLPEPVLEEGV